jgi:hypothetical protein
VLIDVLILVLTHSAVHSSGAQHRAWSEQWGKARYALTRVHTRTLAHKQTHIRTRNPSYMRRAAPCMVIVMGQSTVHALTRVHTRLSSHTHTRMQAESHSHSQSIVYASEVVHGGCNIKEQPTPPYKLCSGNTLGHQWERRGTRGKGPKNVCVPV